MSEAHALPASATLAPWAEVVPGGGSLTIDDLAALPDDGWLYELVEGVLVRMPPSGFEASNVAARLLVALGYFVQTQGLGEVTGSDGGYALNPRRPKQTVLAPDAGFVRADRLLPRGSPDYSKAFPGGPDLAVEVASPTQSRRAMARKAQRYLAAGTRLVWIIWPRRQEVQVWHPGDSQPSATLGTGDLLDGEDVVPGFTYPITRLFT
jgi:Uma2 family endonuclease